MSYVICITLMTVYVPSPLMEYEDLRQYVTANLYDVSRKICSRSHMALHSEYQNKCVYVCICIFFCTYVHNTLTANPANLGGDDVVVARLSLYRQMYSIDSPCTQLFYLSLRVQFNKCRQARLSRCATIWQHAEA